MSKVLIWGENIHTKCIYTNIHYEKKYIKIIATTCTPYKYHTVKMNRAHQIAAGDEFIHLFFFFLSLFNHFTRVAKCFSLKFSCLWFHSSSDSNLIRMECGFHSNINLFNPPNEICIYMVFSPFYELQIIYYYYYFFFFKFYHSMTGS